MHLASTVWFILCVGYVLVLALRQAGFHWWVIFSLSGHSALIILLMVSLYLFAIFRGVSRSQKIEVEHPLTSTKSYVAFYVTAPFWGGVAGCIGMLGVDTVVQFLTGVVLGTLATTFLAWVVVDPVTSLLETVLAPESRAHRAQRLAQAKAERQRRQKERERLLAQIVAEEQSAKQRWQEVLKPQAEKLAALLTVEATEFKKAEREAVGIGLEAWQLGGLNCMRELSAMAAAISGQHNREEPVSEYISVWWDGIGTWRAASLA
jgi:hypothetical protein